MPARICSVLILLLFSFQAAPQLKSPEEFLGYPIGSRFTPHWRIVNYFHHVAANANGMMTLQQYGETNEGRPLLAAFISSEANMRRLDQIRLNNLRLANSAADKMAPVEQDAPVIVWLSYNVHGNETSSSEAAMMTLYSLMDPGNSSTKNWLGNTVIVIDPCLNPDGRDRYVNWYNSVVGDEADVEMGTREHQEPWPGGRTNHYNFDLNRDWAWQTQVETQQRMILYNQWLPQVHVDYHEQFINDPYYFAPAAQPYHEVITKWQRDFQETIGRNNAKYFDQQGWLYFTKEYFDLLYPSYGDTYPTYNGAIGMTYEQAGHSVAGTAVVTETGDTLTLYDRALHHHTTGLSTIEISSQNASKLVSEFRKFFNQAVSAGIGGYKTYVIKNTNKDASRIQALVELMQKNGIRYGAAGKNSSVKGFNYQTGKDEAFSIESSDLIISALQPKSALVQVLFEPSTTLVDSFTYDITAWSLPYAYGLSAFATVQRIDAAGNFPQQSVNNPVADPYAYILHWNGMPSARVAAQLLQKGIKLRFHEQPFEAAGQAFERGSIIILKTGNQYIPSLWQTVRDIANAEKVQLYQVNSGFVDKGSDFGSDRIVYIKPPRIALFTGEGVSGNAFGELWHYLDRELNYPVSLINLENFNQANWSRYDVLIMPNGNYSFLNNKESAERLRNWIQQGGKIIAMQNAVSQLGRLDWAIKSKKSDDDESKDVYESLKRYEDRERDFIPGATPGAIYKVELDNTHPLAFGYPDYYYTLKLDDNIYEFIKEGGWNVGVIRKSNQVTGFVGSRLKEKLKDGLIFGVQDIGSGNIVYLSDNPIFRDFWENGKLMLANALFLVGQ